MVFSCMLIGVGVGDIAGGAVVGWVRGTGGQEVVYTRAAHTYTEGGQVFWFDYA